MTIGFARTVGGTKFDLDFFKKEEICLEENQSTFIVLRTCPWSG